MIKNLKKSEKILLVILALSVVLYLFLNVFLKKFEQINKLSADIALKKSSIFQIEQGNAISGSTNSEAEQEKELDNKLLTYKNDYYIKNFSQDYLILKLNDFLGENSSAIDGFMIQKIAFEKFVPTEQTSTTTATTTTTSTTTADTTQTPPIEPQKQISVADIDLATLDPEQVDYLYVTLDFVSNFDGLVNYTKNIEKFSKSAIITSVNVTPVIDYLAIDSSDENGEDSVSTSGFTYIASDGYIKDVPDAVFKENGTIKGTMTIAFIDFKIYEDNLEYHNPIFDEELPATVDNPFKPYDNFTHYNEPTTENNNSDYFGNNGFGGGSGSYNAPQYIYSTINDFETNQVFFSSSPSDTKGTAGLSPLSYSGNYAGKLTYNFIKGLETSTASYVFDTNNVLITERPETIALKVYQLTAFPYELGVTIKDSSGATYNILLTEKGEDNYSAWKTYEAELPELTYPCLVKRVFITTEGTQKTQLQGELLFDELQVSKSVN